MIKYQATDDLDDKEAPKDLVGPSDKIEKSKEDFVAPSAKIDKTTKESTKTQRLTNISTMIIQLEP